MFWMVTILLLFFSLHHDLRFEDADNHDITYKWWEAVLLPYTLNFKPNGCSKGDSWKSSWEKRNTEWRDGQKTPNYRIRIVLVMPSESGIRSWSFYEFTITMLSAAVYFYGTFVWLSVVFLGAVPALHYVGLTIGVYVAIRIIDGLSGDIYSSVSPACAEEPTSTVVDVSKAT